MGHRVAICLALLVAIGSGCGKVPFLKKEAPPPAEVTPPPAPAATAPETTPLAPQPAAQKPQPAPPTPRPAPAPKPEVAPVPAEAVFRCPAADPVATRKHWLNAVNSLEVGEAVSAEHELRLALCQDPDNKIAASLLQQIKEPPEALFGAQWSDYTVQSGDTLSKIADRYLGDPLLFYGVARYNQIDNPSRLKVGDVIRVPSRKTSGPAAPPPAASSPVPPAQPPPKHERAEAPPVDRSPPTATATPGGGSYPDAVTVSLDAQDENDARPVIHYTLDGTRPSLASPTYQGPLVLTATTTLRFLAVDAAGNASPVLTENYSVSAPDPYAEVRAQLGRGEYAAAIGPLEKAAGGGDKEARALLVTACTEYADVLTEQGKVNEAQEVLQKASAVAPDDPGVRTRLQRVETRVGVEQLYQNGLQAAGAGDLQKALSDFEKVLELDPNHGPARQKVAETRKDLVELYSKQAQAAFRRQDLEESIDRWDHVLALDPGNELAKLRRAEAVDLKTRFEQKFENKPAQ